MQLLLEAQAATNELERASPNAPLLPRLRAVIAVHMEAANAWASCQAVVMCRTDYSNLAHLAEKYGVQIEHVSQLGSVVNIEKLLAAMWLAADKLVNDAYSF
jgi:hypothetical protein